MTGWSCRWLLPLLVSVCVVVVERCEGAGSASPSLSSSVLRAEEVDVVVAGAGLCGATAAFYLHREGCRVLLAEEDEEVGGCVRTRKSKMLL